MKIKRNIKTNFIKKELLSLYPDKYIKLADLVTKVRIQKYNTQSLAQGKKLSYRRICVDFKGGICIRKWGKINNKVLVKMDGSDNWIYLAWINEGDMK